MSVPAQDLKLSIDEYLKLEQTSDVRHEYVAGRIFAMVGSTEAHNTIVTNLTVVIGSKIRGSGCRAFANDMKVHVEAGDSFYYPDLMVTCEPFSAKSLYKSAPSLIVEVLSPSTQDIDRREKLLAYRTLPSLNEYVIVYQDKRRIELYKRQASEWAVDVYQGADCFVLSPCSRLELTVSLDDVYESVVDG